jgi:glycine/D-amino acid oxidase-like deaminating enzyme
MGSRLSSIAIVGAGIVGASVAYHLARQGASVTLIEQAQSPTAGSPAIRLPGSATQAVIGLVGPRTCVPPSCRTTGGSKPRYLEWQFAGAALCDGATLWFRPAKMLTWLLDNNGLGAARSRRSNQTFTSSPSGLCIPDGRDVDPVDPVDPVRTTEALVHAAHMLGAQVVLGAGTTSLEIAGGHVEGVMSSAGFCPASTVVLALAPESACSVRRWRSSSPLRHLRPS